MHTQSRQISTSIPEHVDCLIIGAGIAGLACGYYLKRAGKSVLIVERHSQAGGWIKTENINGFLLETGPNTALAKADLFGLLAELNIADQTVVASPASKLRYLAPKPDQPLQAFPLSPLQALTTKIISTRAKLRLLLEPFIGRSKRDDLSLAEFCTRRFGKEVTHNILAAVVNGILAPDIHKLSARSAFPLLWELDQKYGSIVRGGILRPKNPQGQVKSKIISFTGGLKTLVESLSSAVGDSLLTSTTITAVSPASVKSLPNSSPGSFKVNLTIASSVTQTVSAANIISTEGTNEVSQWLSNWETDDPSASGRALSDLLRDIPHTAIGIVHFTTPSENFVSPIRGFGFLVPPNAGLLTLGTIFSSSLFPHTAPKGQVLLTTFVGGMRNKEAANVEREEILRQVQHEVSTLLRAKEPLSPLRAAYVPRAIPNPAVGHFRLVEQVRTFENNNPGLYFLGNWLEGVSLNDRVREAGRVASRILQGT